MNEWENEGKEVCCGVEIVSMVMVKGAEGAATHFPKPFSSLKTFAFPNQGAALMLSLALNLGSSYLSLPGAGCMQLWATMPSTKELWDPFLIFAFPPLPVYLLNAK